MSELGTKAGARIEVSLKPRARDCYRGVIRSLFQNTGIVAVINNKTQLDLYLRGVVPAEMPSSWPVVVLRAQATPPGVTPATGSMPGTGSVGPVRRLA